MKLIFLTGNQYKLDEAKSVIPEIEALDIDLPEIQSLDAHEVIKHKLQGAFEHHEGEFIVEDTSLYIDSLKGLPGPLIKWFMETVGNEGLVKMAEALGGTKAEAKVIIGYANSKDNIKFFQGSTNGTIVAPRGELGWGWDPIFLADGYSKTFGEMTSEEKYDMSMRKVAFSKLKLFLEENQ